MSVWGLSGALFACASADSAQEPTWPELRVARPVPMALVEVTPAAPADSREVTLDGRPGLRPATEDDIAEPRLPTPDPNAAFPLYGSVFHFLAHVYDAPRSGARAVGYMRRGSLLRAGEEVGRDGCDSGWYALWSGGYVCRDQGYRLSTRPETRGASDPAPNLADPLPYRYVKVVAPAAQTWHMPRVDEDAELRDLVAHRPPEVPEAALPVDAGVADSQGAAPVTASTDAGVADGGLTPDAPALPSWVRMFDEPGHYLTIAQEVVREDGEAFLQTVRGAWVPKAATLDVDAPAFEGVVLPADTRFPVAVAYRDAPRRVAGLDGRPVGLPDLPKGGVLPLEGESRVLGKHRYLQAQDGSYVRESHVRVLEKQPRPVLVPRGSRWVLVDLPTQTLTAYEDEQPIYVTLVSTGKDGFGTPEGLHRVHAKHVTTTMDASVLGEGAYYIEDVPWTMYFQGSYALHGAFWHDRFGRKRSHGCINLAPRDAHWLFHFLTPNVPGGQHGVLVPGERPSYVMVQGEATHGSS